MPPHLDLQLRERIFLWHHIDNIPIPEIAHLACCGVSTVYRIIAQHRPQEAEVGAIAPSATTGRPRILSTGDIDFVSALLEENPTLFLDELQGQL
ncbi:hypothetical protein C8Q80DRAFT_1108171, partial [Daedaleopsis nitida]